jgi:hypothetical protein
MFVAIDTHLHKTSRPARRRGGGLILIGGLSPARDRD